MSVLDLCLIRSVGPAGEPVVRLGMPLADGYLEFLAGRCRPNTVLAVAHEPKVFFRVVAKEPQEVVAADVLGSSPAQAP
jgi:integrase/recombinase XerD